MRSQPTPAQLKRWLKRAKTLHDKAHDLMDQMMSVMGADNIATDYPDNVLHATEELVSVLKRPELEIWQS